MYSLYFLLHNSEIQVLLLFVDDDRPLLQKEYPRVTQSSIEKEENAIIEKIKASVKRFKNNNKLNGMMMEMFFIVCSIISTWYLTCRL